MKEQLRQIADHYGLEHQLGKLEEESNELIDAANDYKLSPEITLEHLLEEIGDVENVIYQIKYLLTKQGIKTVDVFIECTRENKIERQLERMEKEQCEINQTIESCQECGFCEEREDK